MEATQVILAQAVQMTELMAERDKYRDTALELSRRVEEYKKRDEQCCVPEPPEDSDG